MQPSSPPRSSRAEIRNPILTLPSIARLRSRDPETRLALQALLLDLQREARVRAEASWRSRKPPVAAYWAACGVYAGHIARAIGQGLDPRAVRPRTSRKKGKGVRDHERECRSGPSENPMSYDVAFRYNQALDPSALITIGTTLHAIQAAITDCRNAGIAIESDPAVILLARHLTQVCADRPTDADLRKDCMARVAALRNRPVLKTLALRGVSYDEPAKRLFHSEGRAAMRRLADALGFDEGGYDIGSNKAGPAVSGEITLHSETLWVQLSIGPFGPDREVCFRKVRDRHDHIGERNHWASVRELVEPDRFAIRLRRELGLAAAEPLAPRLVA